MVVGDGVARINLVDDGGVIQGLGAVLVEHRFKDGQS